MVWEGDYFDVGKYVVFDVDWCDVVVVVSVDEEDVVVVLEVFVVFFVGFDV